MHSGFSPEAAGGAPRAEGLVAAAGTAPGKSAASAVSESSATGPAPTHVVHLCGHARTAAIVGSPIKTRRPVARDRSPSGCGTAYAVAAAAAAPPPAGPASPNMPSSAVRTRRMTARVRLYPGCAASHSSTMISGDPARRHKSQTSVVLRVLWGVREVQQHHLRAEARLHRLTDLRAEARLHRLTDRTSVVSWDELGVTISARLSQSKAVRLWQSLHPTAVGRD